MYRLLIFLLPGIAILFASAHAENPPNKMAGISDPRSSPIPVILYNNQKQRKDILQDPLLVFARMDSNPPNQILGVQGTFSDEQILQGLKEFYREWRPPVDDVSRPRPQLILAQQNWGCGAGLYEPLKTLSAEFEIDVYQLYPVITQFEPKEKPTDNDKRLAELIQNAYKGSAGQPATRSGSDSEVGDKPQPEAEARSR